MYLDLYFKIFFLLKRIKNISFYDYYILVFFVINYYILVKIYRFEF